MIKWFSCLLAMVLFTGNFLYGQQRIVRGLITDETNQPLSLTNIGIVSNSITTMSNRYGKFTLKIPSQFHNDSIIISLTGFYTVTIAQKDFPADTTTKRIILIKQFTELPEVVVTPPDAKALILEAIGRIPDNTFNDTATITNFYRELVKKGDKPMVVTEAAFELFNAPTAK